MSSRRKIEAKIAKKVQEIQEFEGDIREAKVYIHALQDVLKMLPRDKDSDSPTKDILRTGSMASAAREVILKANRPLHISELLDVLGKKRDRKSGAALASSLSAYVRRGEIFTRPKPNTFGLVELHDNESEQDESVANVSKMPPPGFGKTQEEDDEDIGDDIPF